MATLYVNNVCHFASQNSRNIFIGAYVLEEARVGGGVGEKGHEPCREKYVVWEVIFRNLKLMMSVKLGARGELETIPIWQTRIPFWKREKAGIIYGLSSELMVYYMTALIPLKVRGYAINALNVRPAAKTLSRGKWPKLRKFSRLYILGGKEARKLNDFMCRVRTFPATGLFVYGRCASVNVFQLRMY